MKRNWLCLFLITVISAVILGCCFTACGNESDGHAHEFTKQVTTEDYLVSPATCTEKAKYCFSCECGEKGTELFEYGEQLGHTGGTATCNVLAVCTRCGESYGQYGEHKFDEGKVTTEPTCTEKGVLTQTCTVCKTTKNSDVDPSHKGEWYVTAEPRCFDDGERQRICTVCDALETEKIPMIGSHELQDSTCVGGKECKRCNYVEGEGAGHVFTEWAPQAGNEATCQQDGIEERTCRVCNAKEEREVRATGHKFGTWEIVTPATCTSSGASVAYCSVCGVREEKVVPMAGHSGEYVVTKEATCTTNGTKTRTCTVCGNVSTMTIAAAHDYRGEWNILQPATCTTTGLKSRTCYVCSHYEESIISKVSHEGEWVVTTPATCEENGVQQQTCINCGQVTNKALSKLGHDMQEGTCTTPSICSRCNYEEWVGHKYGEERVIEEPDCARYGYAQKKCEKCGDISTRNIDPVGHEFGEWTVRKEYNCLEDGKERRTCTVCQKAEDRVVEKLGHDFGNEVCYYNKKCSRCDEIDQKPHVYGDDGCTVCGLPYTDINYKLSSDGAYYSVTGINSCDSDVIFIRPTYNGKPVEEVLQLSIPSNVKTVILPDGIKSIGKEVFRNCADLINIYVDENNENYRSIDGNLYSKDGKTLIRYAAGKTDASFIIPNTVTEIGDYAFYNCSSLTSVTIGNGVTSIGEWTFYGCTGLTNVEVPDSVTSIGILAFSDCSSLASVTIGNGVKSIGNMAFYNCRGLSSIEIPGSVESIGNDAFSDCTGLTSVTIGNGVTSIDSAFNNCTALISISVDENNENYKSIDGNLYSKDGKTLIIYAYGKTDASFIIPDGVTSIGNHAFSECTALTSIVIPNSVTSIGDGAFSGCNGLTSIKILGSVTSISDHAFSGCSSLASVEIPGSVTSIGDSAFSGCSGLTSIEIPGSVTSIGDSAFSGCSGLTSIVIPESVKFIGNSAFWGCIGLTSVTIGSGVTSIGENAFHWCAVLTSITYNGTMQQWNDISKGTDWNSYTGDYTIVCTDGTIKKNG